MPHRARAHLARTCFPYVAFVIAASSFPRIAAAERVLAKVDDWEIFTDGRAGAFASWAYGDGLPATGYVNNFHCADPNDMACAAVPVYNVSGGGFTVSHEQGTQTDPAVVAALRQWVFQPTLLNGAPVPVIMTVTIK